MASRTFGVGVVGTGWVAGAHIDTFKQIEGVEVVAVCSRELDRAEMKIAEHKLPGATPYSSYARMLADEAVDIVVICTPHHFHAEQTIEAARAGKHVVIEKPAALNRADLRRMVAAVNKARVVTSVCFELRWIGLFRNIKAILEQDLIGPVFYGECSYFHGIGPWYKQWAWNIKKEIGGSALLTAGCHALDGLIWFMNSRVVEVSAMSGTSKGNPLQYEYDPNSVAILRFANGALGKVGTSVECRQPYLFPVLLQGEQGTIWNDRLSTTKWPGLRGWATLPTALPESGDVHDHPYLGQLTYFVECIRTRKRPHNDLQNAAHVHEVMFAIDDAIRGRRNVKVPRTPST